MQESPCAPRHVSLWVFCGFFQGTASFCRTLITLLKTTNISSWIDRKHTPEDTHLHIQSSSNMHKNVHTSSSIPSHKHKTTTPISTCLSLPPVAHKHTPTQTGQVGDKQVVFWWSDAVPLNWDQCGSRCSCYNPKCVSDVTGAVTINSFYHHAAANTGQRLKTSTSF